MGFQASALFVSLALLSSPQATFRSDIQLVNILAVAHDRNGRMVTGLTKDDFLLAEDSRPQPIHDFVAQSDLPLTLGLLVDTSGSMSLSLAQEREASLQFLEHALRPGQDRAFLMKFDSLVNILSDIGEPREKLEASVLALIATPAETTQRLHRTTALFDGIVEASDRLKPLSGRKALVVLTDGHDEGSFNTLDQAIEVALQSDVSVYTVLIVNGPAILHDRPGKHDQLSKRDRQTINAAFIKIWAAAGRTVLARIIQQTGGDQFEVDANHSFASVFAAIGSELRNQYRLGLLCDEQGAMPGFHSLDLRTKRLDLTVQSRRGFYAAPR